MVAMMLYENESERRQHLSAIQMLAATLGIAEDSVRQLYETELQSLIGRARVRDYLSVVIMKRLKERIRRG